jgi:hypothetical protein
MVSVSEDAANTVIVGACAWAGSASGNNKATASAKRRVNPAYMDKLFLPS